MATGTNSNKPGRQKYTPTEEHLIAAIAYIDPNNYENHRKTYLKEAEIRRSHNSSGTTLKFLNFKSILTNGTFTSNPTSKLRLEKILDNIKFLIEYNSRINNIPLNDKTRHILFHITVSQIEYHGDNIEEFINEKREFLKFLQLIRNFVNNTSNIIL